MSVTRRQASDLLEENYGGHLSWDDPEWWDTMCESLMEFPNVKALRRDPQWSTLRIPRQWPGGGGRLKGAIDAPPTTPLGVEVVVEP